MADQQSVALTRSRPGYAVAAVTHPAGKLALLVGLGMATLLASVAMAVAVVVVAAGVAWFAAGSPYVRKHFDELRTLRDRRERLAVRQAKLAAIGVDSGGLVELSTLVDLIEDTDDGWTARRFNLDDLLDRYVAVAISHQRCVYAMHTTDRMGLLRALASTPPSIASDVAKCRRDLIERRIATWDRTALQATRFEDELAAITDLVRLLAQRAACPDALADADLVQWRLAELDAEDAAMAQLTSGVESEAA
jgi:hypothetical protein